MRIEKITVQNIGPFLEPLTLELDARVTVLTGGNDVGKSSFLRALQLAFTKDAISQEEVNHDFLQKVGGNWTKDPHIFVETKSAITRAEDAPGNVPISPDDWITINRKVGAELNSSEHRTWFQRNQGHNPHPVVPVVIRPKIHGSLRDELNLRELKPLEQALLDAAFESKFEFSRFEKLNDLHFTRALMRARKTLNKLLERVMPSPGMVQFDLHEIAGDRTRIALMLRDRHDGITPFGRRGDGVRTMVTLLAELITTAKNANHRLVLLDEPENSLHADAQHLLREFLWAMTENGQTQVVYATHSPSMINPLRPEQIRVLVREPSGETATTKLLQRPASENFAGVRTTLGLSAADSLLYAPVTIVTEGETEVRNILPIIQKLAASGRNEFSDADKLLGLCTFLDGMGDSYNLICRVARSHGTHVVLFLDGDKRRQVIEQNVEASNPGMPIVYTPGTSEFEELVPKEVYIRSALELVGLPFSDQITTAFDTWTATEPRRSRLAFSKRVEFWFRETFEQPFLAKAKIMRKAIELAAPSQVTSEPLIQLLQAIRLVLRGSSFD